MIRSPWPYVPTGATVPMTTAAAAAAADVVFLVVLPLAILLVVIALKGTYRKECKYKDK